MLRATLIALFTFICPSFSQELPKFPKTMPGVVNIPHLPQQPTKTVKPVYPPEAKMQGIEGTVVLQATLDKGGKVEDLQVLL